MTDTQTTPRHTPGPWTITHQDMVRSRDRFIADCQAAPMSARPCPATPEDMANARLIAAAPDLLEALKRLRDWWATEPEDRDGDEMPADVFDGMHAAIAKAEG